MGLPVNLNSTKRHMLHCIILVVLQKKIYISARQVRFEGFLQIRTFQNKSDANEMQGQTHFLAALI